MTESQTSEETNNINQYHQKENVKQEGLPGNFGMNENTVVTGEGKENNSGKRAKSKGKKKKGKENSQSKDGYTKGEDTYGQSKSKVQSKVDSISPSRSSTKQASPQPEPQPTISPSLPAHSQSSSPDFSTANLKPSNPTDQVPQDAMSDYKRSIIRSMQGLDDSDEEVAEPKRVLRITEPKANIIGQRRGNRSQNSSYSTATDNEPLTKTQRRNMLRRQQQKEETEARQKAQAARLYQYRMEQLREKDKIEKAKRQFVGSVSGEALGGGYSWGTGSGSTGTGAQTGAEKQVQSVWNNMNGGHGSGSRNGNQGGKVRVVDVMKQEMEESERKKENREDLSGTGFARVVKKGSGGVGRGKGWSTVGKSGGRFAALETNESDDSSSEGADSQEELMESEAVTQSKDVGAKFLWGA